VKPQGSSAGSNPVGHLAALGYREPMVFSPDDGGTAAPRSAVAHRILIVEDEYLVALQMESALAAAGFEIAGIANSAAEALELATRERPALAIMDIRLSGKVDGSMLRCSCS
jgi:PleD family two-component response regulator